MKNIVVFTLCLILSACAFSPVKRPDTVEAIKPLVNSYDVSSVKAKESLEGALVVVGYEPIRDGDDNVLTKARNLDVPEYCDCGTWNGKQVTGFAASVIRTNVIGAGPVILELSHLCKVTFTGTNIYGVVTRQEQYSCASNRKMENSLLTEFEKYLD